MKYLLSDPIVMYDNLFLTLISNYLSVNNRNIQAV